MDAKQRLRKVIKEEVNKVIKEADQFEGSQEVGRATLFVGERSNRVYDIVALVVQRKSGWTPYLVSQIEGGRSAGISGFDPFGTHGVVSQETLWKGRPIKNFEEASAAAKRALDKSNTYIKY